MKKGITVLLLICTCLLVSACGTALVVDSAGDLPDADPNDGVCITTNHDCTLRAAIMEANVSPDVSKITFKNITLIVMPDEFCDHFGVGFRLKLNPFTLQFFS